MSIIKWAEQTPIEWSKDFEENIRILLHDKLTWRSKDGSISSLVVIDDKTLKDIVTGIWFYVGKEASKYLNKELKVEQKPAEKSSMLKKLKEHLANTPEEQLDAEFEALKDLTIDKPVEWSKKDEECRKELIQYIEQRIGDNTTGQSLWKKWHSWLNSLPERFNLSSEQKWSEKDKDMLLSAIEYIQTYPAHRQSVVDWLKNLPNRFCPQYKQKWNEEDETTYDAFMCEVVNEKMNPTIEQIKWFRGIRDRLKSICPKPKQERSDGYKEDKSRTYIESYTYKDEELQTRVAFYTYKDEDGVLYLSNLFVEETSRNQGFGTKILKAAEKFAEAIGAICIRLKVKQDSFANAWYRKNGYGYMTFEDGYDWLEKTLEYLKPQWKPSEEQIDALANALSLAKNCGEESSFDLRTLYEQLKKL